MTSRRILAGMLAILLTACVLKPSPAKSILTPTPTATSSQVPSPTFTPSATPIPSPSPTPTSIPAILLRNAEKLFFDGDYSNAQMEFQKALSTAVDQETRAGALWGLGGVEYAAGNTGKALEDLKNLVNTFPGDPNTSRAYFLMGEIYMFLERYSEALQAYGAYLALRPGVIDNFVLERRGDAYSASANYTAAISAYKTALTAAHIGNDTELQIKIAQAYASSGDTNTALGLFDSISKASSNQDIKARMDLLSGRIHLALGQTTQAYQRFLDAVDNYPASPDSHAMLVALVNDNIPVDDLNRGLTDYFAGQYGFARDALQNYINANPKNDGTAPFYHAMSLLNNGHIQAGLDELSIFIKNYPDNKNWQSAWSIKADTQWSELGDYAAAAQTYLDFARINPDILFAPQALLNAGRNYERADRLEDAAHTWDGIADSYPGSDLVPQALFRAGIARYREAKYDQALLTVQRELQVSNTVDFQAPAYFWIGKTQQVLGNEDLAKTAWQQAAALDPTNYYSLRSQDMLLKRPIFAPSPIMNLKADLPAERVKAEAWLRVTFKLPPDTDLGASVNLLADPRLVRGTEFWSLGLEQDARKEFDDLSASIKEDPAATYGLAKYLLDLGLYYPAITDFRQVLTLAGMTTQAQTLAAPDYFNRIRYGLYFEDLVIPTAKQYELDPLFLYSVIRQESLFNQYAVSTDGALGLMQILPSTGQNLADQLVWPPDYKTPDLLRPNINVSLGTYFLAGNLKHNNGDQNAALASYNSTPNNTDYWQNLSGNDPDLFVEVIRIAQTSDYIRSIYELYNMYRIIYGTSLDGQPQPR
jgi:soluble lytic murein transglycosylase